MDALEFDRLAKQHRAYLVTVARKLVGNADADDAVQDALVRAWRGRAGFREGEDWRRWAYRIVYNCCIDILNQRISSAPIGALYIEPVSVAPETYAIARVAFAQAPLQKLERRMILLECEGFSSREIAKRVSCAWSTVCRKLKAAHAVLAS